MQGREITYTFFDDDGKEVTETEKFWFHLSTAELVEWQSKYQLPLDKHLQDVLKKNDTEQLFAFFKKLILDSFGRREDGGRTFFKSQELRDRFERSAAYSALFDELTQNENKAAEFLAGVFPKSIVPDQPQPKVVEAVQPVQPS